MRKARRSKAAAAEIPGIDGILLVDKPEGVTSAHVVAVVKRILGGVKTGHLGTLDPFASGLLPLCLGEGTKIAPYLNEADKSYAGVLRLGVGTDTLDRTGAVVATGDVPAVSAGVLEEIVRRFTGQIDQVPPAYSAIKRDGVRMYELARRGQAPPLEARRITIHALDLQALDAERLRIAVSCSKGTYVRSLARDIGESLGCPATLESLVRTRFGPFRLDAAASVAALSGQDGRRHAIEAAVTLTDALSHLRALRLVDPAAVVRLRAGQQSCLGALEPPGTSGERARVVGPDDRLLAVIVGEAGRWRLERVFAATHLAPIDRAC